MTSAENTNVQQVAVEDGSEDGITLMDLMRIIRKHLVTAAIVFVMVFAGVTAYTFLVPPKYTATAQAMATYNASQGDDAGISQQYTGGTRTSPGRSRRIQRWQPPKPCLNRSSKILDWILR